jgi:hypothetical protein
MPQIEQRLTGPIPLSFLPVHGSAKHDSTVSKKREIPIPLMMAAGGTFTDAYYANFIPSFSKQWLYTAGNWDLIAVYFVAEVKSDNVANTVSVALSSDSSGNALAGSELTTTSISRVRLVSGDLLGNLVDGKLYYAVSKINNGGTGTRWLYEILIVQAG